MLIPREIDYENRTYTISGYNEDYGYYTYIDKYRDNSIKVEIKTEDELRGELEKIDIYSLINIPENFRQYFDELSFLENYVEEHWDDGVIGVYEYEDIEYCIKLIE